MKLKVTRAEMWAAIIEDRPAGLAEKLERLVKAGANFDFVLARRLTEDPGKGVVFLAPLNGARQLKAAAQAGFMKTESLHALRLDGADQPGLCARLTRALANAGINLRGLSATVTGRKFIGYVAVDDADDAAAVLKVIKRLK
jgi:hypothetical protein